MFKPIKHSVWGTRAPDVCTIYWDQASWDTFAEGFRPESYTGGRYDQVAYDAWVEGNREEIRREFYARYGMVPEPVEAPDGHKP